MITPGLIKSIQDIMRQDDGIDGDAQRLSQLVWMVFLKILDDTEQELELVRDEYTPAIPAELQWRSWAADEEGMTAETLITFVNNDMFPRLRNLPRSANPRTAIVREAFEDSHNYMKSGTLLRQVINRVNKIDFNASDDRHQFNDLYEKLLRDLQSAGNAGEFYTPRALTRFIVEMIDPRLGESVLDPACGTGGFLSNALDHMRRQVTTPADEQILQDSIQGVEKRQLPHLLALTNMMLHGIDAPTTIRRGNTLARPLRDYGPADRVDVIVTNPPFGGTEEPGIESNFPRGLRTRETADLFLALIIRLLKPGGRSGIVLPDASLWGEGLVKTRLKEQLLSECNLHTIVRLPPSVFAPYTPLATNLLFFTKGTPTSEIWFYEHRLPVGAKAYNKTKPIRFAEFAPIADWWNDRRETEQAWRVPISVVRERNFNLDIKNPNASDAVARTPTELLTAYRNQDAVLRASLEKVRATLAELLQRADA